MRKNNTIINNKINASINFNNPQNDIKPINNLIRKQDNSVDKIDTKSENNTKPNNTYITTINITSSSEQKTNTKTKIAEQKPIINQIQANNNNNKLAKNGNYFTLDF